MNKSFFSAYRFVGRAGESAAGGAGFGEPTGPELLANRLGGGRGVTGRWAGSYLGIEYGEPAEEHSGPAQGRGGQRASAGKANQLRERSVAGLS